MKLLVVHERFGAFGGAEANACLTSAELALRGHAVGLVHGEKTGRDEETWKSVFPIRFELGQQSVPNVLARALAEFAPDLVYVHKMANLEVIERLVDSDRPLVRMVHDHDIYCMKSYKYAYFSRRICRRPVSPYCLFPCGAFLARNRQGPLPLRWVSYRAKQREVKLNQQFNRLVVVSHYMREELLRNHFRSDQIEIHPPVPRMGDAQVRSSFSDRNLIVFAGQIIRGKGVDILLRSLARIQCHFECIILGEGGHRKACERLMKKLGLENRVQFRGFVPQHELKEYYRECSVVVLSSVWPEPIATIGLEAMRYALPVVAFDAGGIKDWLLDGQNGFLVPWMDERTFAARIEQLLRNKGLAREMGAQGLALAAERFGFNRYISDLETMFQRVRQEHASSPGKRRARSAS